MAGQALPAIVRTVVPYVVGWLLSLGLTVRILALLGVSDADARAALTKAVPVVLGAVYYVVVRWLERNVDPRFGVLLGSTAQPAYTPPVAEQSATTVPIVPSDPAMTVDVVPVDAEPDTVPLDAEP